MKKKYTTPLTEVIKIERMELLQASQVRNQSYDIWYGGVDYTNSLEPD